MWIRLELSVTPVLFNVLYYFPPKGSKYAEGNDDNQGTDRHKKIESPYDFLLESIMRYSRLGEVFLMREFNIKICKIHNVIPVTWRTPEHAGTQLTQNQTSWDMENVY